jgi:hypothetical protein
MTLSRSLSNGGKISFKQVNYNSSGELTETRNSLSDRPLLWKIFTQFLVLRILPVLRLQTFERRNDFCLRYMQRVGDHAHGLFEAEASIAVSAAHALQDVYILVIFRHGMGLRPFSINSARLKTRPAAS